MKLTCAAKLSDRGKLIDALTGSSHPGTIAGSIGLTLVARKEKIFFALTLQRSGHTRIAPFERGQHLLEYLVENTTKVAVKHPLKAVTFSLSLIRMSFWSCTSFYVT